MKSVLFCSHGGLITPITSGQINYSYTLKQLEITNNPTALWNTSLEPAMKVEDGTQIEIQKSGIVYFDNDGYERVRDVGLESDPYLVAIGEYYQSSAIQEGMGDYQGYGAIFKVTLSSDKVIFVTMGDLKDPAHTKEAKAKEHKNFYAGSGESAHTLEFFCNFLNENTKHYSDNMTGKKGSDVNWGKAFTIMDKESPIINIELLIGLEIEWGDPEIGENKNE